MEKINPEEICSYKALNLVLEGKGLTEQQKVYALKQITPQLIKDSRIYSFPQDFPLFLHYFSKKILDPLKENELKIDKTKRTPDPLFANWQITFLKKITFVDALIPLQEFRKFVLSIRKEFHIQPEKLLRELGLSKEELEKATYIGSPRLFDAVLRKLGESGEIKERHKLALRKLEFEECFFLKNKPDRLKLKKPNASIKINGKRLWIPVHQRPHVRNYILYGISTGNLFSLKGSNKLQGREWERRILKPTGSKTYIPFLRSYLYYLFRETNKDKSIRAVGEKLQDFGFPAVLRRETDHTLRKRYEDLFLK